MGRERYGKESPAASEGEKKVIERELGGRWRRTDGERKIKKERPAGSGLMACCCHCVVVIL